jgi:signal transduction histidine kinase/CheY-like chemotaxis protein
MLDALPAPVCLLDPWGIITAGNAPWRRLVEEAGCPHPWAGVGSPYAAVLQALRSHPTADLSPVWRALQELERAERLPPGEGGGVAERPHPTVSLKGASGPHPHAIVFTRVAPEGGGGLLATHLPRLPDPPPTIGSPSAGRPATSTSGALPSPLVAFPRPADRAPVPGSALPPPPPPRPPIHHAARPAPGRDGTALAGSRYRAIFEGIEAGLLVVEPDGTVRAANPAAGLLLGEEPARLVGRTLGSLGREAPGVLERAWDPVNRTGKARGIHRFRGSADRDRFLAWSARAGVVEGRHLVMLRLPDEVRGGEDPLRQARKLEALGQVTGGIAHEINNVLTIILAGIDIVLEDQAPGEATRQELGRIRRAAEQGADTVRRLLTFSRRRGEARRPVDLGEVVRGMEDLLDRVLPGRITLRVDIQDPAPLAVAGPGDVEEILLNLVSNARDAMAGGGTMEIRLRRVRMTDSEAEPLGLMKGGEYLALAVRDSGTGMSPAVLDRAFEPFFTTKGVEGGAGLGLSLVYGLMREHGGGVGIRSSPGGGTSVTLWFPAVALPGAAPAQETGPMPAPEGGEETILLVEDDDAIRSATSRILQRFGYRVLTAADGDEAMELLSRDPEAADLVVSDVVMPRAGGVAVYQAARALPTPPRFLFMSGYAASEFTGMKELPPEVQLLSKPWTAKELLVAVRRALEGPRPRSG